MSRDVCELCGRVSVGFVEDHVRAAAGQTVGAGAGSEKSGD